MLSGGDTGYRLAEVDEVLGCLVVQTWDFCVEIVFSLGSMERFISKVTCVSSGLLDSPIHEIPQDVYCYQSNAEIILVLIQTCADFKKRVIYFCESN